MPHLASFRREGNKYYFRIQRDGDQYGEFIEAIRQLQRLFKPLSRQASTSEFFVPANDRTLATLALVFPQEVAIIQKLRPAEIAFPGGHSTNPT